MTDRNGYMCTTPVSTQRKMTLISGPTTYISVTQGCSLMFETISISRYSESMLPFWVKHSITVALLLTPFSPGILGVCGAQFEVNKIEKTLPAQPHPP